MTDPLDAIEAQAEAIALQVEALRQQIASLRPEPRESPADLNVPDDVASTLRGQAIAAGTGKIRFANGDEHDV